jgi:chromosomal replication initiation ATPase DnaA
LLHLYNACREAGRPLLLTARRAAAEWGVALPDLASRRRALVAVGIAPPDDALLAALLVKHFADRQLRVRPEVIAYLVAHMERSSAAAAAVAGRLEQAGGEINLALARRVLGAQAPYGVSPTSSGDR